VRSAAIETKRRAIGSAGAVLDASGVHAMASHRRAAPVVRAKTSPAATAMLMMGVSVNGGARATLLVDSVSRRKSFPLFIPTNTLVQSSEAHAVAAYGSSLPAGPQKRSTFPLF